MKSPSPYLEKSTSEKTTSHSRFSYTPRSSSHKSGMRGRPTLFGDRMVTVSFRIPASYAERIEKHSEKAKESKSDFFRRAIDLALREEALAGDPETHEEKGEEDRQAAG